MVTGPPRRVPLLGLPLLCVCVPVCERPRVQLFGGGPLWGGVVNTLRHVRNIIGSIQKFVNGNTGKRKVHVQFWMGDLKSDQTCECPPYFTLKET